MRKGAQRPDWVLPARDVPSLRPAPPSQPPAKRPVDVPVLAKESRKQAAAGGRQRQPVESLKAKRVKQKQAVQQVGSCGGEVVGLVLG